MSQSIDLAGLLGDTGLDPAAASAMQLTGDTLGPAIMAGLGDVDIDDITTAEVLLVTLLLDDSGSIRMVSGNTEAVREGHNGMLDALGAAKQSASVLISCRYLNGNNPATNQGVLYPYRALEDAERLTASNYNPQGGTPLYSQAAITLTGVAAKMAEFEQGGVAARAVTVIVTDGGDNSGPNVPTTLTDMVTGLLRSEQHIIAGMGIDDKYTDFRQIFGDMGIAGEWILTPGNTPSEIRRAFAVVSQSAVRASQAAGGSFSQVAIGGFGATP